MTPANDNTPTKARSLADLGALLAYRSRPEHFEPVQSGWTIDPSEVKIEREVKADLHTERYLRMTPSIDVIVREMHHEPVRASQAKNSRIVSIGKLFFADGEQTEKADTIGPDGSVIQYDRIMPEGAMLGCDERLESSSGGGKSPASISISNSNLADRMGVTNVNFIPGKKKRSGKSYTRDESQAIIDEAIANTPVLPPVTKYPPGLPTGTRQVSDCFIGMKIGSSGKGGAMAWQDMHEKLRERDEWMGVEKELSTKDRVALGAAMRARSYADIGVAVGQSRQYADKGSGGRRALRAANDNLTSAMRKSLRFG